MRKRGEVEWIFHFIRFKEFKFTLDLKSFFFFPFSRPLSRSLCIRRRRRRCSFVSSKSSMHEQWKHLFELTNWISTPSMAVSGEFLIEFCVCEVTQRQCPSLVSVVFIHRQCFAIYLIFHFTANDTIATANRFAFSKTKKKCNAELCFAQRVKSTNWIQRNGWMRRVRLEGIHFDNG